MSAETASASTPPVRLERHGDVGVIVLHRPEAMNAVNAALATALGDALEEVDRDPDLRVAVVTGTGRAFCAGMDLKAFAAGEDVSHARHPEWGFGGVTRHVVATPVIAAINGFAMGGGAEIALACDLAVMAESAVIGLPEVRRGLVAAAGGLVRLPRQVPSRLAMELVLTGEPVTAERALALGLVNRVAADGELLDVTLELAAAIARNAPLAVQASKRILHEVPGWGTDWADATWDAQDALLQPVFASEDALEGARAFAERREPQWAGR